MRTILLGFDAFDPDIFERLYGDGKLPNLGTLLEQGGYARLSIANPAQSEVSWTSIATGLSPGGHGLYDFVHRNPGNYSIHVSMLPTKKDLLGARFLNPHNAKTLFDQATELGYPATSLWWPATFPARRGSPVRTIPGLGTPDILGRLGVGTFYSADEGRLRDDLKTNVAPLAPITSSRFSGSLHGPLRRADDPDSASSIDFVLETADENSGKLHIAGAEFALSAEAWSDFIPLTFKMKFGVKAHAITRVVMSKDRGPSLYFLPFQIHPLHAIWPYAQPPNYARGLWKTHGPFLTLGWPQDTTALEEGFLGDAQFLALCESIFETRRRILLAEIGQFNEGVLAAVFDSLDRMQHMYLRDRPDLIESWYMRHDQLLGEVLDALGGKSDNSVDVMIVSDHGFTRFAHKVHLNAWLRENSLLQPLGEDQPPGLANVDWGRTRAYAIGLCSVYINLRGRESEGIVEPREYGEITRQISAKLLDWKGPSGDQVVRSVKSAYELYGQSMPTAAPDLIIGFNHGYRASAETGLGQWKDSALEPNRDHWGADHCVDPDLVPGVLFSNSRLEMSAPAYDQIAEMALGQSIDHGRSADPESPEMPDEDQETLEKRLRDLGYL